MKPPTKCGRVHFEHSHRKWLVITVRPTTSVRKSPRKNLPSRNTPDSFCRRFTRQNHRYAAWAIFFFYGHLSGRRPLHLAGARPLCRLKAPLGLLLLRKRGILLSEETKNPNPSPIEKRFGFSLFGAMEGTRTPGLLIRSQSLYPAELPTHTFRSEHDVFYHEGRGLSTAFLKYFYIFQKRTSFL